jgi:hypothetical protein
MIIFVLVMGLILYAVWRNKRLPFDVGVSRRIAGQRNLQVRFVENNSFLISYKLNTLDFLPPSCSDGLVILFIQIN